MSHDWLLVGTLGAEPAVVAKGRQTQNLVPISQFLRKSPHLMAIQTAIGESVRSGQGLSTITPKNDRVIRTEVVTMTDGRVHGVQMWIGPPDEEPPERPVVGSLKWDLTTGEATDTKESLEIAGRDPEQEPTHGRAFDGDLPARDLTPGDVRVWALGVGPEPNKLFVSTWDITDQQGDVVTVGFVARVLVEPQEEGGEHVICRALNWRATREESVEVDRLAQRFADGCRQPGSCRVLVNIDDWKPLRWLDDPPPFFDWNARTRGVQMVHPADAREMARMTMEFVDGTTSGILRLRGTDGGWRPVALTVERVDLDADTYAGLVVLRLPTDAELADAALDDGGDGDGDGESE